MARRTARPRPRASAGGRGAQRRAADAAGLPGRRPGLRDQLALLDLGQPVLPRDPWVDDSVDAAGGRLVRARPHVLRGLHEARLGAGPPARDPPAGRGLHDGDLPLGQASTGAGVRAPRVAPALAVTTSAIAATSSALRLWPITTKPARAAIAGSMLISTPKTCGRMRRSASSSSE